MDLIQDKLTIVLAGNFNPAILTPQWVARNALGYEGDRQFQVEMLASVVGIGGMPRYSFDGLSYAPNFQSLTFFLAGLDEAARQRVVHVASTVLGTLPHTPVSGVGFNFGFFVRNPSDQLLEMLQTSLPMMEALGDEAAVVSRLWSNTVRWRESLVTVQCQQDGGQVQIDVNIHHDVSSAEEAGRFLARQDCYQEAFAVAVDAVRRLANEQLENV